ncbi:hypothetical protein C9J48_26170 [Photobacterium profundum]|uniref:Possible Ribosomal protein L11 n=1 Tax=Photobacterium profundum 3TCK TaxID=314280 RepID=Q1YW86_9GAMM|nr:MAPEG family protein [Photobacterium profundum]EAS40548.1 possible Ribosomal protein L11 [Photobacterium profundum 3TCK]PSV57880.1 hypothetical protein C9J48_26170 [Photobacterium profundum]
MTLSEKQTGVLKGMLVGALTSVLFIVLGVCFNPFSYEMTIPLIDRLAILGYSLILPLAFLVMSVGRLAKHRFFTPEDIDGSGLSSGSAKAKILQGLLQNTLEQFGIALGIYVIWSLIMPGTWLSVIPLAAIVFAAGRCLFFWGYEKGAASRALGFALTFYSSVVMFVVLFIHVIVNVSI